LNELREGLEPEEQAQGISLSCVETFKRNVLVLTAGTAIRASEVVYPKKKTLKI